MEESQVLTARYRTAWPRLRPLPLELSPKSTLPLFIELHRRAIEKHARTIISRYSLDDDDDRKFEVDVWLVNRQEVGFPDTSMPTLMISGTWSIEKQARWKEAVRDIVTHLYKLGREFNFDPTKVHIDMQAPELTKTIYYGPVNNETLCNLWDNIRALVYQRLEHHETTCGRMTAICLFHYGTLATIDANPITIYISVNYDSPETEWLEVINDIRVNICERGWTNVGVHIEHNIGMNYSFDSLPSTGSDRDTIMASGLRNNMRIDGDYQQLVGIGDSFGAAHHLAHTDNIPKPSGAATLGCYVELKTTDHPDWKRYALSSYNAIRPAFDGFHLVPGSKGSKPGVPRKPSHLWTVDQDGYLSKGNVQPSVHFESPSRDKHDFTIWYIEEQIALETGRMEQLETELPTDGSLQARIDETKVLIKADTEEKEKKLAFFNDASHKFGKLFAASGFTRRTLDNTRLDWALIDVDERRQGSNLLPSRQVWQKGPCQDIAAHPFLSFGRLLQSQSKYIGLADGPSTVWKVGATTGPTTARLHKTKSSYTMAEDSYLAESMENYASTEYIYQPYSRKRTFCGPGDPGSAVFDERGGIVGLLTRGHKVNKSFDDGFGLVTPIEHVFEDIKAFSKGFITDIRVAGGE